jgi:phosphoserine phosphatase
MPDEVEAPRGLCSAAVRIEADERELTALRAVVRAERVEELAVVLVPVTLLRAERILLVTDVDSTLIEQEVIELLAAHAGREAEVAEVTERAMRGELDFAGSLHHRVRALSGLPVSVIDHVAQRVTPTAGAKELVDAAHRLGHKVGAVSGGFIQVLRPLAQRLGLDHAHANVLAVREGCLTGRVEGPVVDRAAKRESLIRWCEADSIPLEATIGMGDGANDLDLVTTAALGVGLQPKPALRTHVDATLDLRRLDTIAAALGWPLE